MGIQHNPPAFVVLSFRIQPFGIFRSFDQETACLELAEGNQRNEAALMLGCKCWHPHPPNWWGKLFL